MKQIYKQSGYELIYFVNDEKFATKVLKQPDRTTFGIEGEIKVVLTEDTQIGQIKLKKGDVVSTILYPHYEKNIR